MAIIKFELEVDDGFLDEWEHPENLDDELQAKICEVCETGDNFTLRRKN